MRVSGLTRVTHHHLHLEQQFVRAYHRQLLNFAKMRNFENITQRKHPSHRTKGSTAPKPVWKALYILSLFGRTFVPKPWGRMHDTVVS